MSNVPSPLCHIPPTMPQTFSLPPIRPSTTASEALDILFRETNMPGRHYLPCDWLRELARGRMAEVAPLTPAQKVADKLVPYVLSYLSLAHSGDAGHIMCDDEIAELTALVEPLRPLPPPTLEEALQILAEMLANGGGGIVASESARKLIARVPK